MGSRTTTLACERRHAATSEPLGARSAPSTVTCWRSRSAECPHGEILRPVRGQRPGAGVAMPAAVPGTAVDPMRVHPPATARRLTRPDSPCVPHLRLSRRVGGDATPPARCSAGSPRSPQPSAGSTPAPCGADSAPDPHATDTEHHARSTPAQSPPHCAPASRSAKIHRTCGAVTGSGSNRCRRRPQAACARFGCGPASTQHGNHANGQARLGDRICRPHRPLLANSTCQGEFEGGGSGIVPPLLTAGTYDEARIVDEAEARRKALPWPGRKASSAGTSSALNVVSAIHLAREIGEGQTVKCHDACASGVQFPKRR